MIQPLYIIDIDHTIIEPEKIEQEQVKFIARNRPISIEEFRVIKRSVQDES